MHIFVTLIKESIDLGGIGGKKGKRQSDIYLLFVENLNFSINNKKIRWLIHAICKVIPKIPVLFF